jgi:hypothetical protein
MVFLATLPLIFMLVLLVGAFTAPRQIDVDAQRSEAEKEWDRENGYGK